MNPDDIVFLAAHNLSLGMSPDFQQVLVIGDFVESTVVSCESQTTAGKTTMS